MTQEKALTIKNLSVSFGGVKAVDNVSFDVNPGEVVGLIGPNGAGKTTIINCICGYHSASSGLIQIGSKKISGVATHRLRKLGISRTFQETEMSPELTVMEVMLAAQQPFINMNILRAIFDFPYLKREENIYRRKIREVLRRFRDLRIETEPSQESGGYPDLHGRGGFPDLLDVENTPVSMLPYGVRKKLDLARALLNNPKYLLLDEPAAGLGELDKIELEVVLQEFKEKYNPGVLLVDHHMAFIMKICNRIVVLDFGKVIAIGTPDEIRKNPDVIKAYLGKGNAEIHVEPESVKPVETRAPLIELKEIDVFYGQVQALSRLSLSIYEGGITAILGSNGAGKSTLMKSISGIEKLSRGEIWYDGEILTNWLHDTKPDKIVRKGIVQVPEGRRVIKELTVFENLKLAGHILKTRASFNERLEVALSYFPILKKKLSVKAGNLSGGQQQMLAIGQGLMMSPRVLLLDEPGLGLSPNLIDELYSIVGMINKKEKCTVVLVEQNVYQAFKLADMGFLLETGYLIKSGTKSELLRDKQVQSSYLGTE